MARSIDESGEPARNADAPTPDPPAVRGSRLRRGDLAGALAVAALAAALATQFAITQGSPVPGAGLGFVLAVILFGAGAWVARRPRGSAIAARSAAPRLLLPSMRGELALLAGVLALAVFFRFFHLVSFPPGIWYDEGINGTDAISIIEHDHLTVWRTSNFGHSTIYFYLLIVSFRLFGYTVTAFRVVPAIAGLAAVVAFYFLARWLLDVIPALVATALMAVSRFPVTFSRVSWEASLQPLVEILAVYFLFRALETKRRLYFVLAGGSLAAGLYTYLGFRFVPVMVAFFLVYITIAERQLLRRNLTGLALYALSFAVVVLPLAQYAVLHPDDVLARTRDINVFKEIDQTDSYAPLKDNVLASVKMINVAGDRNGRHNLPGAPALDEVSAALVVLGLAVSAWSIRDWRRGSVAGWLVLALVPGALTISTENPSEIRAVGAIPPIFLLAGLAIAFVYRVLTPSRAGAALFAVGAIGLVGGSAALNYHQLFGEQAHSEDVHYAFIPFYTTVGEIAAREAHGRNVYIAARLYDYPVVRVLTHGKEVQRWEPSAQAALRDDGRDAVLLLDTRSFNLIPALRARYPQLQRTDDVDRFGHTYFTTLVVPAPDIAAVSGRITPPAGGPGIGPGATPGAGAP